MSRCRDSEPRPGHLDTSAPSHLFPVTLTPSSSGRPHSFGNPDGSDASRKLETAFWPPMATFWRLGRATAGGDGLLRRATGCCRRATAAGGRRAAAGGRRYRRRGDGLPLAGDGLPLAGDGLCRRGRSGRTPDPVASKSALRLRCLVPGERSEKRKAKIPNPHFRFRSSLFASRSRFRRAVARSGILRRMERGAGYAGPGAGAGWRHVRRAVGAGLLTLAALAICQTSAGWLESAGPATCSGFRRSRW